jgi:hypothetical protein
VGYWLGDAADDGAEGAEDGAEALADGVAYMFKGAW